MPRVRALKLIAAASAVVVLVSGCTAAPTPSPTTASQQEPSATFTFGTPAPPMGLDPALSSDLETYRVTRQVLEGLVTVDSTTGKPAASLATDWKVADDGTRYDFTLRQGVLFQDGTPFNASAVCTNFQRWYKFSPTLRKDGASTFGNVFRAYSDEPAKSVYRGCTVTDPSHVRIDLSEPYTGFLQALTMPSLAISSPQALAKEHADTLNQSRNGTSLSAYALHPVGTGPFSFDSWTGNTVTLTSNPTYWGDRGQIKTARFVTISHPEVRREALAKGEIDAYDNITVDTMEALVKKGEQVVQRDPFSIMYLGMNQSVAPLDDIKVRQAIEYAVDKNALIRRFYLDGTGVATQFVPPRLAGFNNKAPALGYDPNKAKALLKDAGYNGKPIPFYYPVNVTRSYLPAPEKVYAEIARELTAVGLVIKPVPVPWTDGYAREVTSAGNHGLHLFGWNGSYADPDNFLTPLFGSSRAEFGFSDPELFKDITQARTLPDGDQRSQLYTTINNRIASDLPALPIAYPISALAMSDRVLSYPASPVLNEVFSKVKLKG
ncbi:MULTISPECIES: ABC transporter substrate-binding protein [Arthrobacter]|uniref:ABC transporter substrate-binding protein n=2 Tax=Arthrobacter TaxID=1663 RepID=A0ABU9KP33_9MICC|nr:ABC transporter substrate-binding protein [Arthrobacter sp. YJM1]MDP5228684.1 ABC transporter substrate-binding protein [Arthrobacter sp. YJM1]